MCGKRQSLIDNCKQRLILLDFQAMTYVFGVKMKRILYWPVLVWIVLSGTVAAGEKTAATNGPQVQVEKQSKFSGQMSYALGYDVFTHISSQVDLDMEAFIRGVRDALKGTSELETDRMRQLLAAYQRLARKSAMEEAQAVKKKNLAQGGVFLEGNKLLRDVVVLSSGLQYKVIKEGTGPVPGLEDNVECHYRGRLLDGTEFDSSYSRGRPAVFQVSKVIAGWTQALTRMPVGSKWELYIPPELAYGDEGAGDLIRPGHTLIFEVELLGILDPS